MPVISKRELGPARRSRHRWFAADSLSRSLTARFLVAGLVPLLAGAGLLVAQQRSAEASTASQNAHARAAATAANLERTFGSWRTALLVAADNPAPRNCYRHPEQRDQLRPKVDSLLLTLHRIAPQLIDEACFIAADGHESGSSLTVVKCWCGDRVWACVIASWRRGRPAGSFLACVSVRRRSSRSTSFVLAALRALHVDISSAPAGSQRSREEPGGLIW